MSTSEIKVLGPAVGYVDLLDHETTEAIKRERTEGNSYQKTPIRPSAAGKCTRELYYDTMQFQGKAKYDTEVQTPALTRLFALGHSVEWSLIGQIKRYLKAFEVKYSQQVLDFGPISATDPKLRQRLEGSIDLCLISDEYKCVIDIKSKKDRFAGKGRTGWDITTSDLSKMDSVKVISGQAFWVEDLEAFLLELDDAFFAANFLQLNLYANAEFIKERGIDHAAIIQYGKNDSRIREVRFKPHRGLYDKTVAKFQTAVTAVDTANEALATRDFKVGSMKCAYCPFNAVCRPNVDAKAEFRKTFWKKK